VYIHVQRHDVIRIVDLKRHQPATGGASLHVTTRRLWSIL